jgi:molybdenum cofactor cytidylyltransferase
VLATTTTAMFLSQLQAIGPVLMSPERGALLAALPRALAAGGPLAAARDLGDNGKVTGLPIEWVDEVWGAGDAGLVLVEADGSRGLSLKAFGPNEPQVPDQTTLIVQVAGLDVLGAPLDGAHVHRFESLIAALSEQEREPGRKLGLLEVGRPVTVALFVAALSLQFRALRGRWPAARIVTLLNKAEDDDARETGLQMAARLLEAGPEGAACREISPEAVVVGSLQQLEFTRCAGDGPLVSAVVLAAGRSTRMGAPKLLLPVEGRAMVERVVAAAAESAAADTVVVVGSEAAAVSAALGGHPVRIVVNPDHEQGMSTSLRAGLSAVPPGYDAVLFVLGDQPFVTPAVIDRLIRRFAETGAGIVRPLAGGGPAHPVLMASRYFPEIQALDGDVGAREILARHPEDVAYIELEDPRSTLDVDTPADYKAAES